MGIWRVTGCTQIQDLVVRRFGGCAAQPPHHFLWLGRSVQTKPAPQGLLGRLSKSFCDHFPAALWLSVFRLETVNGPFEANRMCLIVEGACAISLQSILKMEIDDVGAGAGAVDVRALCPYRSSLATQERKEKKDLRLPFGRVH
eukprot:1153223-Pelagomonas_calceolata.AAC.1